MELIFESLCELKDEKIKMALLHPKTGTVTRTAKSFVMS